MGPEKSIEQKFRDLVKDAPGFEMKLTGMKGIPDRLVIIHGKVSFIEFKAPGGTLSPAQSYVSRLLLRHGANVGVFDDPHKAFHFCS